ncbi:transcription initiation factor TFIID subunit 12-like [Pyrus ussuriensis x Pyrus communis]|uniref:Transcription initiation factor TFIID subunit 12-like n=1 Tax=Pyrus ussuriensis x Pyrus communis TaxID=2448454 RepID=A0A5N5G4E8_9ROSA|nr:transcription initiation factor TFIID subunit 12-like [Pyrus ussuriensis x Pyrus communis]
MSFVEFVCRVPALSPARVFSTPPRSPLCLLFSTVLLGNFSELQTGDWLLSLGCQLPFAYGCAQEASEKEMIGGGRRISWLESPRIDNGECSGCFSVVLSF